MIPTTPSTVNKAAKRLHEAIVANCKDQDFNPVGPDTFWYELKCLEDKLEELQWKAHHLAIGAKNAFAERDKYFQHLEKKLRAYEDAAKAEASAKKEPTKE